MAGSGPCWNGATSPTPDTFGYGAGRARWLDQVARKDAFLAAHPEWTVTFQRDRDIFEAVREDRAGQTIITDRWLGPCLDRMEAATPTQDQE